MANKNGALERAINAARPSGLVFLRRQLIYAALVGLIGLTLGACGTGDAATPATEDDNDARATVVIDDLAFSPETLTIEAGDTVTWTWRDGAIDHDVSGDDFQSEVISEGTFRHRFDEPGAYDYICTLHPNMTGTIEVTE